MDMSLDLRALLQTFWRRKWFFAIPALLVLLAASSLLVVLPPLYRSEATLLVEGQEIPENLVPSLVTEQIDRRLEMITTRVLVTDNLLRIAARHDLYAGERDALSPEAIAGRMRERIETETVVTAFNDQRTGRTGRVTVAFKIGFLDGDPDMAQRVANDLVSVYLASNLKDKRERAERTTVFLTGERAAVDQRISAIEDELAVFKRENQELLPAEVAFKRQLLSNIEQQLRELDSNLRVLRERESYLATQLALTDEFRAGTNAGTVETRLELLRTELATARARYSASHPDVIRLEREVRSLDAIAGTRSGSSVLAEQEAALTAELAALRERYTDEHPDVQRVQRELTALRRTAAAAGSASIGSGARDPAYVQLSAQLNSVRVEATGVEDQKNQLLEQRVTVQQQLANAPAVEREYNRLIRQLESAMADRDKIADKEAAVRLSGSLEVSPEIGDRLTLVEAPTSPNSPASPSTILILGIGLVLALGSGGASLTLAELLDRSVRSRDDLARIVGETPLVAIPFIAGDEDLRRQRYWRIGAILALLLLLVGVLAVVHQRVVPLDVLGYQIFGSAQQWVLAAFPDAAGDAIGTDGTR